MPGAPTVTRVLLVLPVVKRGASEHLGNIGFRNEVSLPGLADLLTRRVGIGF